MARRVVTPVAVLLACVGLIAAGACSETNLTRPQYTEVHFQNPPTAVDILLVVDNSGSMADEQFKLSAGFDTFVQYFDVADVDYHIGVVTTDMDVGLGALVDRGGVTVITRDTDDAAEVFLDNVRVGTVGAVDERGLDAAEAAVAPALLEGANTGFLRDEAFLSVLFVSDEEDASYGAVATWIEAFRELKRRHVRRDAFQVSALVGVDPETGDAAACGQVEGDPTEGAFAGERYVDVAKQTGGVVGSICAESYEPFLDEVGLASSRLRDRFTLRRTPDLDSLTVTLFVPGTDEFEGEGTVVPPAGDGDGRWAWVYEEIEDVGLRRIRFTDVASLPPVATPIVVRYEAGS